MTDAGNQKQNRRTFQLIGWTIITLIIAAGAFLTWRNMSEGHFIGVLVKLGVVIVGAAIVYRHAGKAKSC